MHDSVAAIRAGRPRTRFASQPAHRRERQLGLRRASRPLAAARRGSLLNPLLALRQAARSLAISANPAGHDGRAARVRPATETSITWSRCSTAGRRTSRRRRSAAPWRD